MRAPFHVPWFLVNLKDFQVITAPTIPEDISDQKGIVLAEQQVPGMNYQPILPGGGENRKISFRLRIVRFDPVIGNITLLNQFRNLRNRQTGRFGWTSARFAPMPKVLYYWGTGSVPQEYWVSRCDATHREKWVNEFGSPQVSDIDLELILDEESPIYEAEELFRATTGIFGEAVQGLEAIERAITGGAY